MIGGVLWKEDSDMKGTIREANNQRSSMTSVKWDLGPSWSINLPKDDGEEFSKLLNHRSEPTIQRAVDQYIQTQHSELVHKTTSGSAKFTPFANSLPMRCQDGQRAHRATDKPDVCFVFPGVMVLKPKTHEETRSSYGKVGVSTYDCIAQCCERIAALTLRLGFLKRVVGFACQHHQSWVISAELYNPAIDNEEEENPEDCKSRIWYLYINPINDDQVMPMCQALYHQWQDDQFNFVQRCGASLSLVAQHVFHDTLPLEFYTVKWLAHSTSGPVFRITPPQPSGTSFEWPRLSSRSIVVKLTGERDFAAEVECVTRIHKMSTTPHKEQFHVIGTLVSNDWNPLRDLSEFRLENSFVERVWKDPTPHETTDYQPWVPDTSEGEQGAIVMLSGVLLKDMYEKHKENGSAEKYLEKAWTGVNQSLNMLRDGGFVHRDIRLPNIMDFAEHGVQLIDFGFAAPAGTPYSCVPSAVKKILRKIGEDLDPHSWTFSLDEQFAEFALTSL